MPRQTCGPCAKATCRFRFGRSEVETIGIREGRRIAIRARERERDEVAARDRRAAELRVARRIAVEHRRRRLEPQRLLDDGAQHALVGARPGHAPPSPEQVEERIRDHRLGRLDPAEQEHRRVRGHLLPCQPAGLARRRGDERRGRIAVESGLDGRPQSARERLPAAAVGRRSPAVIAVTSATMSAYQPSASAGSVSSSPSACTITSTDSGPASVARRSASPRVSIRVEQPLDLALHDPAEPLGHRIESKRPRERIAVAPVLVAVEGEHARADDLCGREARVVDGERAPDRASPAARDRAG